MALQGRLAYTTVQRQRSSGLKVSDLQLRGAFDDLQTSASGVRYRVSHRQVCNGEKHAWRRCNERT